jgi:type III secretory pathway component EscS
MLPIMKDLSPIQNLKNDLLKTSMLLTQIQDNTLPILLMLLLQLVIKVGLFEQNLQFLLSFSEKIQQQQEMLRR